MERSRFLFDSLQELTFLISCLCHDVDHRGHNNAFEKAAKTEIGLNYAEKGSVMAAFVS